MQKLLIKIVFSLNMALVYYYFFFQVHLACPKGNSGTLPSPQRTAARAAPPPIGSSGSESGVVSETRAFLLLSDPRNTAPFPAPVHKVHTTVRHATLPHAQRMTMPQSLNSSLRKIAKTEKIFMLWTHGCTAEGTSGSIWCHVLLCSCTPRNEAGLFNFECALCSHKPFAWSSLVSGRFSPHFRSIHAYNFSVAWK